VGSWLMFEGKAGCAVGVVDSALGQYRRTSAKFQECVLGLRKSHYVPHYEFPPNMDEKRVVTSVVAYLRDCQERGLNGIYLWVPNPDIYIQDKARMEVVSKLKGLQSEGLIKDWRVSDPFEDYWDSSAIPLWVSLGDKSIPLDVSIEYN
jgi:hypothetical protein